jgi:phage-related protein
MQKRLDFEGTSYEALLAFPTPARRAAGYELGQIQDGKQPDDWRPMPSIGSGVNEIRIHQPGAFRVIYIAKFEEAIYVLHCFEKKSQRTSRADLELATARYKALVARRRTHR